MPQPPGIREVGHYERSRGLFCRPWRGLEPTTTSRARAARTTRVANWTYIALALGDSEGRKHRLYGWWAVP